MRRRGSTPPACSRVISRPAALSTSRCDRETVETERGAEVGTRCRFLRLERDTGRIGDSVDRVEETHDAGRIGETGGSYCRAQCGPRTSKRLLVLAEHGFGEFDEQTATRNAAIVLHRSGHRVQIVSSIVG